MTDPQTLADTATRIVARSAESGLMVATAESCTGGLVAGFLTDVPGSSAALERGFVTYSNAAKADLLRIDPALIDREGAVSEAVARAMASGALAHSRAAIAVSVTGVAGPGGGSAAKPVGLVHFGAARGDRILHRETRFGDIGRREIRLASVAVAFELIETLMDAGPV
ncbi:CinA family protein [Aureimonas mangrovi]|uniref:CinA family protein n=1 Tax=Aureimonas mangrovi TaxID=2758041 RepID=UPI002483CD46|nr:CinA family protein [Aureimonas mangrovi]